jgi:uncharacterized NAD(P)/FAD-binding protein YdhS
MQLKNALPHSLYRAVEIIVFEKKNRVGLGVPYDSNETCYRINLKKEVMEPIPGETGSFSSWVNSTQELKNTDFPPRHYFGRYLESSAHLMQQEAAKLGLKITFLTEHDVVDIKPLENAQFEIHALYKNLPTIHIFNEIILSLSHLPTSNFTHLIGQAGYQHNPWASHSYDAFDSNDAICILGSKLTAIDIALKLQEMKHQGTIYMVSRSGLLPTIKGETSSYVLHYLIPENFRKLVANDALPIKLGMLISLLEQELSHYLGRIFTIDTFIQHAVKRSPIERIDQEINKIEAGYSDWQKILSVFYQCISRMWPLLSVDDQRLFNAQYSRLFMTYLCSVPLESAYKIQAMLVSGQLQVLKDFSAIDFENSSYRIEFKSGGPIFTNNVINATGSGTDLTQVPLLKNMLKSGLISKHELGGIRVNSRTLQVIDKTGVMSPHIYAMGDLVKGACFTIVEVGRVAEQAKTIIQNILCKLDILWLV